jgi:serine/threonine-protein kinase
MLSQFKITAKLGEGGMGTVYHAEDTKLGREVAIKVLPDAFTEDAERLARFEREAQVLASLNHPHIAGIYEIGEGLDPDGGTIHFLVMELAEGEDLAAHLERGPIPLQVALPIALQLAQGLEAAYDRGIVHRDLKPANVMVGSDRSVKVLDFGLAKALAPGPDSQANLSLSPTLTAQMTQAGTLLGTAAYMSPEQARGEPADHRADVWAFGVVLMEMLSGSKVFPGKTVSDSLAGILAREPEWDELPDDLPIPIRKLLERCLEKEASERLQAIGEARIAIERYLRDPEGAEPQAEAADPAAAPANAWLTRTLAGLLTLSLVGLALALWRPWVDPPPLSQSVRVSASLGADLTLSGFWGPAATLSPDGQAIVFHGRGGGGDRLFLRRLNQLTASPISGTENGAHPFFSPDGEWIAFFSDNKLKKISIHGGTPITLADAPNARGGSWGDDDLIVFTPERTGGLFRISSAGGVPELLTSLKQGESCHRWPQVLPGSRSVLFTHDGGGADWDQANLALLSLDSGEHQTVHQGVFGRYVATGHLVFVNQNTLFAAPLDLERGELLANPVPVVEDILTATGVGLAHYSVSDNGILAFQKGSSVGVRVAANWLSEDATVQPLLSEPDVYTEPAFSPDGTKLALQIGIASESDVWIYDWERDTLTRLTFVDSLDQDPIWTPDGNRIVFESARDGSRNLYWQRSDGAGEVQRLTESTNEQSPESWHPDGRVLAFVEDRGMTSWDIMTLTLQGSKEEGWTLGEATPFLSTPTLELQPVFSPDGKWLAYVSTESGRLEVYVRPFPGPGGKWQVSNNGGIYPAWSPDGKAIHYAATNPRRIMRASYRVDGDQLEVDRPTVWSDVELASRGAERHWALHPDGRRAVFFQNIEEEDLETRRRVQFVFNFFDELLRVAPMPR